MVTSAMQFYLPDRRIATVSTPTLEQAPSIIQLNKQLSSETIYTGKAIEDCTDSIEYTQQWIAQALQDPNYLCLFCEVGGTLVGTCDLERLTLRRQSHRAIISIAILQQYWGTGLANVMFDTLMQVAESTPDLRQLELGVYESNARAITFYRKFGFKTVSVIPDTLQLSDGSTLGEYRMIRYLR